MPPPPGALPFVSHALEGPEAAALALPPLRLAPGEEFRIEAVTKYRPLQLPSAILMKVPQVQKHPDGLAPPPPPMPPPLPGQLSMRPVPPEEGEPMLPVRQLAKVHGGELTLSRKPPKPPAKLPAMAHLQPTPPAGPPPAHAITLAKPMAITDLSRSDQAILAKVKPPSFVVHPPLEPLPNFIHKGSVQDALANIAEKRQNASQALSLREPLPPGAPPIKGGPSIYSNLEIVGGGTFKPKEKPPKPVPNWVRDVSDFMVKVFVFGVVLESVFFIVIFGPYLESGIVWATQAATLTGCIVNLAFFESLKCLVMAFVRLFEHEVVKRKAEEQARRTRMALKNQRLQERASRIKKAQPPQHQLLALQLPPRPPLPPLMG